MTKAEILSALKAHKEELAERFYVSKIGLFGSYATGHADEKSDIDLLIESGKKDFFLREDLREYLESLLGKRVDVGYAESIRRFYKERIDNEIIYV